MEARKSGISGATAPRNGHVRYFIAVADAAPAFDLLFEHRQRQRLVVEQRGVEAAHVDARDWSAFLLIWSALALYAAEGL